MPRVTRTDKSPRNGHRLDGLTVGAAEPTANFIATAAPALGGETADSAAALFEAGRKILARTTESACLALADVNRRYSAELAGLQLKAITTISESALTTLRLVEAISSAANPNEAAGACVDHVRDRSDALKGIALDFFESAMSLIGALSLNDAVSREPEVKFPIRRGEDPRKIIARQCALLTGQQRSVFRLLLSGLPNKRIAHELGIRETTVKAHVSQILEKLHVFNRAQLIALVARYDRNDTLD
jgi:DNA-binding NarL/FixJ family response regulator